MFVLIAQRDQRSKMIGSLLIGWQKREGIFFPGEIDRHFLEGFLF